MNLAGFLGCKWAGLACTAAKPQTLRAEAGVITSPTMFDNGTYPPNVSCSWKIIVPEWMVSWFPIYTLTLLSIDFFVF